MNVKNCLPLLVALSALAACGPAPAPNTTTAAPKPGLPDQTPASTAAPVPVQAAAAAQRGADSHGSAPGSGGVKAFIDPDTGELRAPTEAEQKTAAAAAARAGGSAEVKLTTPLEGKAIGNGVVEYEVGQRGMVDEVACVQPDGTVTTKCPAASKPK